jgi:hypothetical protein
LASFSYPSTPIGVIRTEPIVTTESITTVRTTPGTYFRTSTTSSVSTSTVYTQIMVCIYSCPEIIWWTSAISLVPYTLTSTTQWVSVSEVTGTIYRTVPAFHTVRSSMTVPAYVAFGLSNLQFAAIAISILSMVILGVYCWKRIVGLMKRYPS